MVQSSTTDIQESTIMQLCVNLVVLSGVSLDIFSDSNMQNIVSLACKGANENLTITEAKVQEVIKINAAALREQLKVFLKNRFLSFSIDMATCRGREFIRECSIINKVLSNLKDPLFQE